MTLFAGIAALVAVAALSNPSAERHRDKLRAAIAERSPLAGAVGLGHLTAFASTYHPLGVASYTTVGERTVTVGLFGMVFVLDTQRADREPS